MNHQIKILTTESIISTRDLVRNFKYYKSLLLSRKIDTIKIKLDDNQKLNLSLDTEKNTGKNIAKLFANKKKPISIQRKDIFGDWLK